MIKKIKIILLIIAVLLLAGGVVCYLSWDSERIITKVKTPSKLDDPNLVYAYKFWGGLCSNGKGEEGGCYFETYLYNTGKVVKESGFVSYEDKREVNPTIEKDLGTALVDKIIKKIKDSEIMAKDCPPNQVMDAGWDYQININGVKKSFRNPPAACKEVFDQINDLLESLLKK